MIAMICIERSFLTWIILRRSANAFHLGLVELLVQKDRTAIDREMALNCQL